MSQKDKKKFGGYNSPQQKHQSPKQQHHQQQQHHSQSSPSQHHHHHHSPQNVDDATKRMRERTVFISMNLIGHHVAVQLKNGDTYEGILTSTNTNQAGWGVALKFARKKEVGPNAPTVITTAPIQQLVIEAKDFIGLTATGIVFDNSSPSFGKEGGFGFHTDTDISGHDGVVRERELTPWISENDGENLEGDFGKVSASINNNNNNSNWDQFATNEKLFGVKTSYNEDLYTTILDRDSENYRERIKDAERLAAEIESKTTSNIHLMEERGHVKAADYDEEERYSSVIRNGSSTTSSSEKAKNLAPMSNSNVYIPPNKRGTSTAGGVLPISSVSKPAAATTAAAVISAAQSKAAAAAATTTTSTTSPTTTTTTTSATPATTTSTEEKVTATSTTPIPTVTTTTPPNSTNSPSHQQQQQHFKESTSGSTGSLLKDSPVTKLRLRERAGSIDQHDVLSSPRDGQSPRTLQSYSKIRAAIVAEKLRNSEPRSPLISPLVSDPVGLSALSLDVSKPNVSEDTIKEFNEFLLTKTNEAASADRKSQIENLKNFSRDLNRSRPGSPLIGPNSPRPSSNLASISLSGALSPRPTISDIPVVKPTPTSASATTTTTTTTTTSTSDTTDKKDEKKDETKSTATTSDDKKKEENKPEISTIKPISKLKLNPNAKEFTPVAMSANAPVFTPKSLIHKPTDFGPSSEAGRTNTDSTTPINEIYYESMKRRQQNPEQPDAPSTYWNENYARTGYPGSEDDYMAGGGQYPIRGPFISIPVIPTYYPPPTGAPAVPVPVKSMKPMSYNGQPPRGAYAPPPPAVIQPGAMGQPPYVFQPPQFQYVPPIYNTAPPAPHIRKAGYPYPAQSPANGYHQPMQPHIMVPQNTSQPPSPSHQSPQIPSPTSPPPHTRMMPSSPQMMNPMYTYQNQPPYAQIIPPRGYVHGANDPNQAAYPPYN